jgi:glucokinase
MDAENVSGKTDKVSPKVPKQNGKNRNVRLYLGIDIGGTKIQASLAEESGAIIGREKTATPREGGPEQVVAALEKTIEKVLKQANVLVDALAGIGLAVPGVVDPRKGRVVVTPNMSLSGVALGSHLESRFRVPVALGNDCNLGALGEAWLGSARRASSVVAILVGTGIGAGFVRKGKLWRGAREAACEVGHIIMQIDGPKCGCGNYGCFEALASRSAIERDLRAAVETGRKTMLTDLLEGDLSVIRSSALRRALDQEDELVTEVMRRASEILGHACVSIRHLIDPEVIVLGGGVIEACSDFMMPIVENIVGSDPLPGARDAGNVLLSALGDDAVVLGAVALARRHVGRSPFKRRFTVHPKYPVVAQASQGEVTVNQKTYARDIFITADGQVKKRPIDKSLELYGDSHTVGPKELEKVCKGGPEVLFIGTGRSGQLKLTDESERYLTQRSIKFQKLPTPDAIVAYNKSKARKAAMLHVMS